MKNCFLLCHNVVFSSLSLSSPPTFFSHKAEAASSPASPNSIFAVTFVKIFLRVIAAGSSSPLPPKSSYYYTILLYSSTTHSKGWEEKDRDDDDKFGVFQKVSRFGRFTGGSKSTWDTPAASHRPTISLGIPPPSSRTDGRKTHPEFPHKRRPEVNKTEAVKKPPLFQGWGRQMPPSIYLHTILLQLLLRPTIVAASG